TGASYVYNQQSGRLQPVANYVSARLMLDNEGVNVAYWPVFSLIGTFRRTVSLPLKTNVIGTVEPRGRTPVTVQSGFAPVPTGWLRDTVTGPGNCAVPPPSTVIRSSRTGREPSLISTAYRICCGAGEAGSALPSRKTLRRCRVLFASTLAPSFWGRS
ncbi:hypothetical protein ETD86_02310, partial [Nonomuraea turkmeniaca]